jgi:hypothetical protein
MPGLTFTLSEYPFNWIELACDRCNRRGRLRKAGLVKLHGVDCGVARLREILIAASATGMTRAERTTLA